MSVPPEDSLVVLVHGFMRTGASMWPMAARLRRQGYLVRPVTQLNVHQEIPALGDQLYHQVLRFRDAAERQRGRPVRVDFATHSMGGIVVRSMLARHEIAGPNRVVMIAPPSRGSRFAQHMRDDVLKLPWGRFDPLRKLLPGEVGDCEGAGDPDAEFGIIAGAPPQPTGFPWSLGDGSMAYSPAPEGEHDGKVALDEARWDRARDFIVLPYGHTWIMAWPEVMRQTAAFLADGGFDRGP